ncbi:MAG: ATP-binding protein [Dehalogenimonas sp.]|nr:ATP-binding protein [Dehalogenimonas sp.]
MDEKLLNRVGERILARQPVKICPDCGAGVYLQHETIEHRDTCPAWRTDRLDKIARFAGLPLHKRREFDNFKRVDGTAKALAAAKLYCDPSQRKHHFLTLSGEPGRGKTHLAQAIAWHHLSADLKYSTKYVQAERMLDGLRRCFDQPGVDFDRELNLLCKIELLVLDDLGTENSTPWTRSKLQEIIDERYEAGRLTVVTTNLRPSQMDARVMSRLSEGVWVLLEGEDYRQVLGAATR